MKKNINIAFTFFVLLGLIITSCGNDNKKYDPTSDKIELKTNEDNVIKQSDIVYVGYDECIGCHPMYNISSFDFEDDNNLLEFVEYINYNAHEDEMLDGGNRLRMIVFKPKSAGETTLKVTRVYGEGYDDEGEVYIEEFRVKVGG